MSAHTYLEFGLPPVGESAEICSGDPIPADILDVVAARYEQGYPGVFILAAVVDDFFCLYHRTKNAAWRKDSIKRVTLAPAGPAKGAGYILMCLETTDMQFGVPIIGSGFNDRIGFWMEERAEKIATMISVPYERLPLGADA